MTESDQVETLKAELKAAGLAGRGKRLLFREMPPSMLQDSAAAVLRTWVRARMLGLTLDHASIDLLAVRDDGSVVFDGFDAFVAKGRNTSALTDLFRTILGPLMVVRRRPDLADLMRRCGELSPLEYLAIFNSPVMRLPGRMPKRLAAARMAPLMCAGMYMRAAAMLARRGRDDDRWLDSALPRLLSLVEGIRIENVQGKWTGYYGGIDFDSIATAPDPDALEGLVPRHRDVLGVLEALPAGHVLDIGANRGLFSILGARAGHTVTAVDNDIGAVDGLYRFNRSHRLPVLPAIVDYYELEGAAADRFRADYALALGFTHHLYLVEGLTWDRIARSLAQLATKVLVTEFKHNTKASHPRRTTTEAHRRGHTLQNFIDAIEAHFKSTELVGSDSNRQLIVCWK